MPAPEITLRTAIATAITGASYSLAVSVEGTYVPREERTDLATPQIHLVAMALDEEIASRSGAYTGELLCQVGMQQRVSAADTAAIDALVDLLEEVRSTLRNLPGYRWLRTQALKDRNGVPYDYVRLRNEHVFQAVLIPTYRGTFS